MVEGEDDSDMVIGSTEEARDAATIDKLDVAVTTALQQRSIITEAGYEPCPPECKPYTTIDDPLLQDEQNNSDEEEETREDEDAV